MSVTFDRRDWAAWTITLALFAAGLIGTGLMLRSYGTHVAEIVADIGYPT